MSKPTVLEICAGAGGQALGLELAGFDTVAAVELDKNACNTLRLNRPSWNVIEADLKQFNGEEFSGIDLLAGGVPCPPFSLAGKQLGPDDERDLFPVALKLVKQTKPRAVMLENVRGLASNKFADYRSSIVRQLSELGYESFWELLYSSNFGVPQLRPRFVLVALRKDIGASFAFPTPIQEKANVGDALFDLMQSGGWKGATSWRSKALGVAPTVVGGSKKHGGADLGPTRAKREWLALGVDGKGIANSIPDISCSEDHIPRLTLRMVARIQGFPDDWAFSGGKTAAYRQIGNAFPPPVARAIGEQIIRALNGEVLIKDTPQFEINFAACG